MVDASCNFLHSFLDPFGIFWYLLVSFGIFLAWMQRLTARGAYRGLFTALAGAAQQLQAGDRAIDGWSLLDSWWCFHRALYVYIYICIVLIDTYCIWLYSWGPSLNQVVAFHWVQQVRRLPITRHPSWSEWTDRTQTESTTSIRWNHHIKPSQNSLMCSRRALSEAAGSWFNPCHLWRVSSVSSNSATCHWHLEGLWRKLHPHWPRISQKHWLKAGLAKSRATVRTGNTVHWLRYMFPSWDTKF